MQTDTNLTALLAVIIKNSFPNILFLPFVPTNFGKHYTQWLAFQREMYRKFRKVDFSRLFMFTKKIYSIEKTSLKCTLETLK